MSENWSPNSADIAIGSRSYVAYATGVAILHNPGETIASMVGGPVTSEKNREILVVGAEQLMWNSLARIIKSCNPPDLRGDLMKVEYRHSQAYPHIEKIVNKTCDPYYSPENYNRLEALNPLFTTFPPLPLEDNKLYRYIAHGRRAQTKTIELMAGYAVHESLAEIVEGRAVSQSYRFSKDPAPAGRLRLVLGE